MPGSRERTLSHAGSELGTVPQHVEVRKGFLALPGGTKALLAFVVSICAYTVQTELAQVVQSTLGYKKPFLSLWLGHSLFSILLPCHLLLLVRREKYPLDHWLSLIAKNLDWQLSSRSKAEAYHSLSDGIEANEGTSRPFPRRTGLTGRIQERFGFDVLKLIRIWSILTLGITIPSLSWYSAVPMTTMADITAIYNTFSVFALVFSVIFLGETWERRKVFSVGLASVGVAIVAYGGTSPTKGRNEFTNPFLGSILALLGALTMGAYEVIFTLIATLPDEDAQAKLYTRPSSRRTHSRTISGAFLRSPTSARYPSTGDEPSPSARRTQPSEAQLLFDADSASPADWSAEGESKDLLHSHERTALVVDESSTSTRNSYESISGRVGSSVGLAGPAGQGQLIDSETLEGGAPTKIGFNDSPPLLGHRPSPLRQTFFAENGSRTELETSPSGFDAESETESELQDGEEEEILAGATRLHRSRLKAASVLGTAIDDDDAHDRPSGLHASALRSAAEASSHWIPPPLPFGLHANIMTSGIGYVTLSVLWIGVVIGHWTGLEPFELPPNMKVVAALAGVGFLGVIFNGTFTLLLALWGPVLASVSIIGATVLVEIADIVVLGHPLRLASVVGCALIVAGFVVLVAGTEEEVVEGEIEPQA
ncbi:unnamed protein product [Tilletia laevis]|uniref:EamA domain-containing protein n=2 Tax=Tilletia caries TaxID=13290 RepID=A0ABN7JAN1_9BASI|nr:unnamed protein product [Tilletia caries]CAD6899540.1 unnamed protein product [Tilletia laevis]CAD6956093.1 unnamed protein product [Tilletia caries]CAD7063159.1 unnamed protein product [Tilletia caries]